MTRVEPCLCGGAISVRSELVIPVAVLAHNGSLLHAIWRHSRGDTAGPYDPRRHWPTAVDDPVDLDQGDTGASAGGVGGST